MNITRLFWLPAAVLMPLLLANAQTPDTPTTPPPPAAAPAVSPAAAEVVRLAEAGTTDDVILGYIQNSMGIFDLSADQILYLRDIGLSSPVITAMLSRDNVLRNQAPSYVNDQKVNPPTAPPAGATPPVAAPEPAPVSAAVEAPPVYVTSPPPEVNYFYDNLSPYGSWVQLEGVGWCWQPRVVAINRGWRPYCDSGHWVYTDAGWFWQSDYSWGWAPFHYGRWHLHDRCGWVWLPDRVWGPAWVTWRSEGDHCGWAPLPPHAEFDVHFGYRFNGVHVGFNFDFGLHPNHFTFIAVKDFHNHDSAHHRLPPAEVTRIYTHTTVINNYVVHNKTIVNQGIKVDRVQAATHSEFRKVAIRDVPAGSHANASPRGGGKSEQVVYRSDLKAPAKPVSAVAQKVDDRHPVIQHAPVMPVQHERPVATRSTSTSSAPGSRGLGAQAPATTSPRPAPDRRPVYSQPQTSPNLNRPGQPSASASATAPLTRPADRSTPAATTTTSASHPDSARQQQVHSASSGNQYSSRPAASANPGNSRANVPRQSSPPYYPKGYHQAAETRILPSTTTHASTPPHQPSASQRPSSGGDSGTKASDRPSKKSDQ